MADDAKPGADWIYVEEGTELTAEQAARKFLDLDWDHQVERMQLFLDDAGAAAACQMLNHEGAMIFATQHSCQDHYQQGWQDGLAELQRKVDAQHGGSEAGAGSRPPAPTPSTSATRG